MQLAVCALEKVDDAPDPDALVRKATAGAIIEVGVTLLHHILRKEGAVANQRRQRPLSDYDVECRRGAYTVLAGVLNKTIAESYPTVFRTVASLCSSLAGHAFGYRDDCRNMLVALTQPLHPTPPLLGDADTPPTPAVSPVKGGREGQRNVSVGGEGDSRGSTPGEGGDEDMVLPAVTTVNPPTIVFSEYVFDDDVGKVVMLRMEALGPDEDVTGRAPGMAPLREEVTSDEARFLAPQARKASIATAFALPVAPSASPSEKAVPAFSFGDPAVALAPPVTAAAPGASEKKTSSSKKGKSSRGIVIAASPGLSQFFPLPPPPAAGRGPSPTIGEKMRARTAVEALKAEVLLANVAHHALSMLAEVVACPPTAHPEFACIAASLIAVVVANKPDCLGPGTALLLTQRLACIPAATPVGASVVDVVDAAGPSSVLPPAATPEEMDVTDTPPVVAVVGESPPTVTTATQAVEAPTSTPVPDPLPADVAVHVVKTLSVYVAYLGSGTAVPVVHTRVVGGRKTSASVSPNEIAVSLTVAHDNALLRFMTAYTAAALPSRLATVSSVADAAVAAVRVGAPTSLIIDGVQAYAEQSADAPPPSSDAVAPTEAIELLSRLLCAGVGVKDPALLSGALSTLYVWTRATLSSTSPHGPILAATVFDALDRLVECTQLHHLLVSSADGAAATPASGPAPPSLGLDTLLGLACALVQHPTGALAERAAAFGARFVQHLKGVQGTSVTVPPTPVALGMLAEAVPAMDALATRLVHRLHRAVQSQVASSATPGAGVEATLRALLSCVASGVLTPSSPLSRDLAAVIVQATAPLVAIAGLPSSAPEAVAAVALHLNALHAIKVSLVEEEDQDKAAETAGAYTVHVRRVSTAVSRVLLESKAGQEDSQYAHLAVLEGANAFFAALSPDSGGDASNPIGVVLWHYNWPDDWAASWHTAGMETMQTYVGSAEAAGQSTLGGTDPSSIPLGGALALAGKVGELCTLGKAGSGYSAAAVAFLHVLARTPRFAGPLALTPSLVALLRNTAFPLEAAQAIPTLFASAAPVKGAAASPSAGPLSRLEAITLSALIVEGLTFMADECMATPADLAMVLAGEGGLPTKPGAVRASQPALQDVTRAASRQTTSGRLPGLDRVLDAAAARLDLSFLFRGVGLALVPPEGVSTGRAYVHTPFEVKVAAVRLARAIARHPSFTMGDTDIGTAAKIGLGVCAVLNSKLESMIATPAAWQEGGPALQAFAAVVPSPASFAEAAVFPLSAGSNPASRVGSSAAPSEQVAAGAVASGAPATTAATFGAPAAPAVFGGSSASPAAPTAPAFRSAFGSAPAAPAPAAPAFGSAFGSAPAAPAAAAGGFSGFGAPAVPSSSSQSAVAATASVASSTPIDVVLGGPKQEAVDVLDATADMLALLSVAAASGARRGDAGAAATAACKVIAAGPSMLNAAPSPTAVCRKLLGMISEKVAPLAGTSGWKRAQVEALVLLGELGGEQPEKVSDLLPYAISFLDSMLVSERLRTIPPILTGVAGMVSNSTYEAGRSMLRGTKVLEMVAKLMPRHDVVFGGEAGGLLRHMHARSWEFSMRLKPAIATLLEQVVRMRESMKEDMLEPVLQMAGWVLSHPRVTWTERAEVMSTLAAIADATSSIAKIKEGVATFFSVQEAGVELFSNVLHTFSLASNVLDRTAKKRNDELAERRRAKKPTGKPRPFNDLISLAPLPNVYTADVSAASDVVRWVSILLHRLENNMPVPIADALLKMLASPPPRAVFLPQPSHAAAASALDVTGLGSDAEDSDSSAMSTESHVQARAARKAAAKEAGKDADREAAAAAADKGGVPYPMSLQSVILLAIDMLKRSVSALKVDLQDDAQSAVLEAAIRWNRTGLIELLTVAGREHPGLLARLRTPAVVQATSAVYADLLTPFPGGVSRDDEEGSQPSSASARTWNETHDGASMAVGALFQALAQRYKLTRKDEGAVQKGGGVPLAKWQTVGRGGAKDKDALFSPEVLSSEAASHTAFMALTTLPDLVIQMFSIAERSTSAASGKTLLKDARERRDKVERDVSSGGGGTGGVSTMDALEKSFKDTKKKLDELQNAGKPAPAGKSPGKASSPDKRSSDPTVAEELRRLVLDVCKSMTRAGVAPLATLVEVIMKALPKAVKEVADKTKPDGSLLIQMLDVLLAVTEPAANSTASFSGSSAESGDLAAAFAAQQAKDEAERAASAGEEDGADTARDTVYRVLERLSMSLNVLRDALKIDDVRVQKPTLIILARTLASVDTFNIKSAFDVNIFRTVYQLVVDDKVAKSTRAAAASVIAAGFDRCPSEAEVEHLCVKMAPTEEERLREAQAAMEAQMKAIIASQKANAGGAPAAPLKPLSPPEAPPSPVALLIRMVSVSVNVKAETGNSTDASSVAADISYALPTLLVAVKALGVLLNAGGERGDLYRSEAKELNLQALLTKAYTLAMDTGGGAAEGIGGKVLAQCAIVLSKYLSAQDTSASFAGTSLRPAAASEGKAKALVLDAKAEAERKVQAAAALPKDPFDAFERDVEHGIFELSAAAAPAGDTSSQPTETRPLSMAERCQAFFTLLAGLPSFLPPAPSRELRKYVERRLVACRAAAAGGGQADAEPAAGGSNAAAGGSTDRVKTEMPDANNRGLRKGMQLLREVKYQEAADMLDKTASPTCPRAELYFALALLKDGGGDAEETGRRIGVYLASFESQGSAAAAAAVAPRPAGLGEQKSSSAPVSTILDPVVLYALAIRHTQLKPATEHRIRAVLYLEAFSLFPVSKLWLGPKDTVANVLAGNAGEEDVSSKSAARAMWERAKADLGAKSPAVDELMAMIGLEPIKREVVSLYYSTVIAAKRNPAANADRNMHFIYVGIPGTGKTEVARLFARILREFGVRKSEDIVSTTGSELLRDVPDDFKQKMEDLEDGVLFVDEVDQLQPDSSDDGRDIMNLMLTAAENRRGSLTIILAGYQDAVDKLLSFNKGLSSRFPYTWAFPDYSEKELLAIFNFMVKGRNITCERMEPSIASIVAARLARGSGRPGFGNARTVRNMVEQAMKRQEERLSREMDQGKSVNNDDANVLKREDVLGQAPDLENSPELAELDKMTGLATVKQTVRQLMELQKANFERESRGEKALDISLHRIFMGRPGTGKTTVAKLYGRLLKRFGFLSNGEVVVKTPSDFIGNVVGSSEKKTVDILESCRGKVLVIDEVYGLNPKRGGANLYAGNVVDTIVAKVQGTPGEDIAIILAGYEDEVAALLREANPGLSRRFRPADAFRFEDYTDGQLVEILREKVRAAELSVTLPTAQAAVRIIARERQKPNFGNAGAVENALTRSKERMNTRLTRMLTAQREAGGVGRVNQSLLVIEDFDSNPADYGKVQEMLSDMVGIDHIFDYFDELEASLEMAKSEGRDVTKMLDMGLAFTGPPGTGKTAVATKFAKILNGIGILASDTVIVQSGRTLQGRYIGETPAKVTEIMRSALGGVLFIDEAPGLSPNAQAGGGSASYNREAVETMLQLMTTEEYKGKMVIILAGYERGIDELFEADPGLASRFPRRLQFPAWDAEHASKVLRHIVKREAYPLADAASACLPAHFKRLRRRDGWANGRDVKDNILPAMYRHRAKRLLAERKAEKEAARAAGLTWEAPEEEGGPRPYEVSDVSAAFEDVLKTRKFRNGQRVADGEDEESDDDDDGGGEVEEDRYVDRGGGGRRTGPRGNTGGGGAGGGGGNRGYNKNGGGVGGGRTGGGNNLSNNNNKDSNRGGNRKGGGGGGRRGGGFDSGGGDDEDEDDDDGHVEEVSTALYLQEAQIERRPKAQVSVRAKAEEKHKKAQPVQESSSESDEEGDDLWAQPWLQGSGFHGDLTDVEAFMSGTRPWPQGAIDLLASSKKLTPEQAKAMMATKGADAKQKGKVREALLRMRKAQSKSKQLENTPGLELIEETWCTACGRPDCTFAPITVKKEVRR